MSVRLTTQEDKVALFDSVSGYAFGPTFDSEGEAEDFVDFCADRQTTDLRALSDSEIGALHEEWQKDEEDTDTEEQE